MKAKDLRNSILQMAVQGKLVPQDPNDEPASVLLERIRAERTKLIKEKKIKAPKGGESFIYRASDGSHYEKRGDGEPVCIDDEIPFEIPENWEWVRLESLVERIHYGYTCSSSQSGTIRLLRITDIQDNSVNWDTVPFCSDNPKKFEDYKLRRLDVLIARTGGTVGKNYVIRDCPYDSVFASYLIRVVMIENALVPYIELFMDAPLYWNQLIAAAAGTGQPNVNSAALGNLLIPIPPVAEQERIVKYYSHLEPHIDQYRTLEDARERLDAELPDRLRKSILQLAVQGRLVEQSPADEPASALLNRIRAERAALVKAGKLKAPKGGESIIYRASDGGYYEKRGKSEPICIDDEIPFEIPENWEWARIRDFGFFSSGKTPSKHDQSLYGGDHLWVTSKDMKSFKIVQTGITLSDKGANGLNAYPVGTMLFVVRSGILKRFLPIAVLDKPATINQDIKALTLYLPEIAVELAYFIKAFEPYILKELTKSVTTVDSLRFEEFQNMLVPVPPEAAWRRIASQLDVALGEVITNR